MLQPFSQVEQALRDTLITKAEGAAFDRLGRWFGFPRVGTFSVSAWRKALRACAYGARGTPGTTQAVLEGMFSDANAVFTCTIDAAAPQTLTYVSGPAAGFTRCYIGRLWRIDSATFGSRLYWSEGPDFIADPNAVLGALTLCRVATAYWKGADWSALPAQETVTATLLPFWVREATPGPGAPATAGAACTVDLLFEVETYPPPTYMQPQYLWANASTPDVAGAVSYLTPGEAGQNAAADVAPVFVQVTDPGTLRGLQIDADAAHTADVTPDPSPVAVPARGGAHVVTLYLNGVATALTCSLGAAATSAADVANSVAVVAGDIVHLEVVADGGVTQGLREARATVFRDLLTGEPDGGNLLVDAGTLGDTANGPWPIYLTDDSNAEIAQVLDLLMAAGVQVRARTVDFCTFSGVP